MPTKGLKNGVSIFHIREHLGLFLALGFTKDYVED